MFRGAYFPVDYFFYTSEDADGKSLYSTSGSEEEEHSVDDEATGTVDDNLQMPASDEDYIDESLVETIDDTLGDDRYGKNDRRGYY
jgi:hypothetical protein